MRSTKTEIAVFERQRSTDFGVRARRSPSPSPFSPLFYGGSSCLTRIWTEPRQLWIQWIWTGSWHACEDNPSLLRKAHTELLRLFARRCQWRSKVRFRRKMGTPLNVELLGCLSENSGAIQDRWPESS